MVLELHISGIPFFMKLCQSLQIFGQNFAQMFLFCCQVGNVDREKSQTSRGQPKVLE